MPLTYRRVAQLGSATGLGPVGRSPSKAWVKGSNPLGRAIYLKIFSTSGHFLI